MVFHSDGALTVGWLSRSSADVPGDDDWLGTREKAFLAGLRFPKRRDDWRLGRWTAKLAVCGTIFPQYVHALPALQILQSSDGSPEVFVGADRADCSISLSHSAGAGLCVVAPAPITLGCDLESMEPRDRELIADHFTADEKERVKGASTEEGILLANLIWSAKESALKALREGMRRDTRSVEVTSLDLGDSEASWKPLLVSCRETGRIFRGWWFVANDLVRTVVTDPPGGPPVEVPLGSMVLQ